MHTFPSYTVSNMYNIEDGLSIIFQSQASVSEGSTAFRRPQLLIHIFFNAIHPKELPSKGGLSIGANIDIMSTSVQDEGNACFDIAA